MPPDLWSVILSSWLPFIVIIVVWVVFVMRLRGKNGPSGQALELGRQSIAEQKRTNQLLEEIKAVLERDKA